MCYCAFHRSDLLRIQLMDLPAISPLQIIPWRIICRKTSTRNSGVLLAIRLTWFQREGSFFQSLHQAILQDLRASTSSRRIWHDTVPLCKPRIFPPSTWSVQSGASYGIWNRRWFPPDYCNSHPFPGLKLLPSSVAPNIQTSSDSNDQKYRTFSLVKAIISRWSFLSLQGKKW